MKKIIILDFETAEVHIADYDSNIYEDFSDFLVDFNDLKELDLRETNCQWLIVDKLNLQIH